jgi:hypothetical protein
MFTSTSLQIGDLTEKQMATVASNLLTLNINYTMDMASQLSFVVIDPGFEMASNNYFNIGRDVVYETTSVSKIKVANSSSGTGEPIISRIRHLYEISSVSVQQQGSASPQWSVEAMPKAVQQMKRDKKPSSIGGSGYTFVQKAANKYGLRFVGEKSARIKSASKNSGDGQQDSVWTVMKSIADNSQYVLFVADGTLYFGTHQWLMYKWGTEKIEGKIKLKNGKPIIGKNKLPEKYPDKFFIPMEYAPINKSNNRKFEVLSLPSMRDSGNDPLEGSGNLLVARDNGVQLRPGMTIRINNVPTMSSFYLITSVTFGEQITDPVSIEFRTPERLKVNGKEPKIPQLPIGKIFNSNYFQPSPRLGATTVGRPIFNETTPQFIGVGTTINPVGPQNISKIPNSRRLRTYPNTKAELLSFKGSGLVPEDILVGGNIDCYNRPISLEYEYGALLGPTLNPHIYPTVIEGIAGTTGTGYAGVTSTTSRAIGTGSKVFIITAGSKFATGQRVRATNTANSARFMEGIVTVSGTTLTMTCDTIGSSGTYAAWTFSIAGVFVVTERLWCNNVPTLLTTAEAETKYESEDLHHGVFLTEAKAKKYIEILILVQKEVIKHRFPKSAESILNRTAKPWVVDVPIYPTELQITTAGLPATLYPSSGPLPLVAGNITLTDRPLIKNTDGSISTLLSSSFNDGVNEVVYTPIINGRIYKDADARQYYLTTGKHLGKFASGNTADAITYAQNLSTIQESWLNLITYGPAVVPYIGVCGG